MIQLAGTLEYIRQDTEADEVAVRLEGGYLSIMVARGRHSYREHFSLRETGSRVASQRALPTFAGRAKAALDRADEEYEARGRYPKIFGQEPS